MDDRKRKLRAFSLREMLLRSTIAVRPPSASQRPRKAALRRALTAALLER
jgi:hypothetical protein